MRSRVESRRNRDDGRRASAGKAVQDLGGYFCDDRLQVWTDGSCLYPRWEAIARAGAGVFFSKNSELNAHFPIKAWTGQTSVRGELEAAAWVETGVKDILDATAKGKTPTKREHAEVWTPIEERIKSFPTGWLEINHVPGHATEEMVRQGRALEEHRLANNQVDLLAKQGAASGGPPQELIEAYLERAERSRRQQEMAIEILEERDHLEEIAPQAEKDPRVTDDVRNMQKPMFLPSDGKEGPLFRSFSGTKNPSP